MVLSSFTVEDKRKSLEIKWNVDVPLDPEEVDTQEILDIEVQWLEHCDVNISLRKTGSNFLSIEDDRTIGSFNACARKF